MGRTQQRAVRKIRAARDEIIRLAAGMQASGTDTSALTPLLIDIQEALAELEALGGAEPDAGHPVGDGRMRMPADDEGRGETFAAEPPADGLLSQARFSRQWAPVGALDGERAQATAGVIALLSDVTRLQLLTVLAETELNVGQLCERLQCRQPTASHHLAVLRQAGMVVGRREGKHVRYGLGPNARRAGSGVIDVAAGATSLRLTLATSAWAHDWR